MRVWTVYHNGLIVDMSEIICHICCFISDKNMIGLNNNAIKKMSNPGYALLPRLKMHAVKFCKMINGH